jgi:hypothetical protein
MATHFDLQFDLPEDKQLTILPLYGGADTLLEEMTAEERERAADQVYVKVREQAFSRGLPVIIKRKGLLIKEFADGHTEPLT